MMVGETAASDLAFRARALAQAHPLSAAAHRIVNRTVAEESEAQPIEEAGVWAGAALTQGYCLRCVQETIAEGAGTRGTGGDEARGSGVTEDDAVLDQAAAALAEQLRTSTGDEGTIAALDLLVGSQVEHRLQQWRDELDPATWAELEQYLTWWVVKGYCLRMAEASAPVR